MKLTKKSIYTIVYWVISCAMMLFTNIDLVIEGLSTDDKLIALLSLPMISVILGIQILFHSTLFVSIRNLTFAKSKSILRMLCNVLLSIISVGVLFLYYYQFTTT